MENQKYTIKYRSYGSKKWCYTTPGSLSSCELYLKEMYSNFDASIIPTKYNTLSELIKNETI